MSHFYRIKPLKWEPYSDYGAMMAKLPFCFNIRVFEVVTGCWCHTSAYFKGTTVGTFKTAEAAMKAAEKAYIKQLKQVLEEVTL